MSKSKITSMDGGHIEVDVYGTYVRITAIATDKTGAGVALAFYYDRETVAQMGESFSALAAELPDEPKETLQ